MASKGGSSVPVEIREAYHRCLEARREYRRAIGSEWEAVAHERLHEAVFDLYEVLRPLISSKNATKEFWEEIELWPRSRQYVEASVCPECNAVADLEFAENGALCPECETAVMETADVPAVDEESGEPLYVWECGLSTLDNLRTRTREVPIEYNDALGAYESVRLEKVLLDPQKLVVVADVLDEALAELDMLADVEDVLPEDTLEASGA